MPKEEIKYPRWVIRAKWNNADYKNNGTSFTVSYRRNYTDSTMKKWAERWWKAYAKKKYPNETPELLELSIRNIGKTVWYGSWFSHKSLNRFDTQEEAFASFRKYFWDLKKKPYTNDWDSMYIDETGFEYCAMGAQDEWRWKYCDKKCCSRRKQTVISH